MSIINAELVSVYSGSEVSSGVEINLNDGLISVKRASSPSQADLLAEREFIAYEDEVFQVRIAEDGEYFVAEEEIDDLRALAMG
ncbi:hypothetical protein RYA05_04795 [Pseudomonas syringae pv. actinidiae]|nr:hypothetical protein [Pseudomonas syringae pv. actinidiae]